MRRLFRILRILKWGGTLLCALVAAVFVLSFVWGIAYFHYASPPAFVVGIDSGRMCLVVHDDYFDPRLQLTWQIEDSQRLGWDWTLVWMNPLPQKNGTETWVQLPLLPLLLLFAAPTLLFWFLDRRRPPPGHCRCGYNLTGLTSNRCPECGTPTATPPSSPKG